MHIACACRMRTPHAHPARTLHAPCTHPARTLHAPCTHPARTLRAPHAHCAYSRTLPPGQAKEPISFKFNLLDVAVFAGCVCLSVAYAITKAWYLNNALGCAFSVQVRHGPCGCSLVAQGCRRGA